MYLLRPGVWFDRIISWIVRRVGLRIFSNWFQREWRIGLEDSDSGAMAFTWAVRCEQYNASGSGQYNY
jgi:hypothetical protein